MERHIAGRKDALLLEICRQEICLDNAAVEGHLSGCKDALLVATFVPMRYSSRHYESGTANKTRLREMQTRQLLEREE